MNRPCNEFLAAFVLLALIGARPALAGDAREVVVVPVVPIDAGQDNTMRSPEPPDEAEPPRAPRRIPEVRDPARGMVDPETAREGDSRSLDQLSRDRLNIDGKRSRSLDDLGSPLRERRRIDQSKGRLSDPGERTYGTRSLRDRLGAPDSRRDYRIESTRRDLREEYIDENGSEDYRVYRTR